MTNDSSTYTGPNTHEWQSLVQLAAKLGAQPAHIINAIDRGQRCMGCYLVRRDVTSADDLESLGLDARTKTLYRVSRFDEQLARLTGIEEKLSAQLRELRRQDIALMTLETLDQVNALRIEFYGALGLARRARARLERSRDDSDTGQQVLV